jgi:presenilin-like A22 family membrane protease
VKHKPKITAIIISMFLLTQLIGLLVVSSYFTKELPYGMEPPKMDAGMSLSSIIISFIVAIFLIFLLMKIKAKIIIRVWFFLVVTLALGLALNPLLTNFNIPSPSLIALGIALPLSILKIFKRNFLIHNLTELLVYPGIASVFVPILNIWTIILLLLLISAYDIYAVWHAGFMQKMAKFQIQEAGVFGGFFVPFLNKKQEKKLKKIKKKKGKKIEVSLAILGGGDIIFPLITAGVVLKSFGLLPALTVSLFSTIALSLLLIFSKKQKFYPAMPFITSGCLTGLLISYLLFII